MTATARTRVVVVTGGAVGIGAAIAEELGRQGAFVVTVDPGVALDGSPQAAGEAGGAGAEPTTAQRIVDAGGQARASNASVTDLDALTALFGELVDEFGALDAVVNVAGISRPTSFAKGAEADWRAVLDVHLQGYLNVLRAALPLMAAAGHGHVLGVTSGSGWRAADAGAYSCAKRAVAALTWQLGAVAPAGVSVNALSPIAATRMVLGALSQTPAIGTGTAASGGLALGGLPGPEAIGPVGAYLAGDGFASLATGRIVFSNGAELASIGPPRLLEVVDLPGDGSLPRLLDAVVPTVLAPAEAAQVSTGGSTPRLGDGPAASTTLGGRVALVTDDPEWEAALLGALGERGCAPVVVAQDANGFDDAAARLRAIDDPLDAVVVARRGGPRAAADDRPRWSALLDEHVGLPSTVADDAGWARATAELVAATGHPTRIVTVVDAADAGGRTRAQAAAQLSRSARGATHDLVDAFVVSVEDATATGRAHAAQLAAHLAASPDAGALSGAELAVTERWLGLRSHPHPAWTITFAGPDVPEWIDGALGSLLG
jgi:NAD(P)-dependent dehydrogenase (short-subunit alcohol dehydrogenase family)